MDSAVLAFQKDSELRCKNMVIGSGAGGSLTASYLAGKGEDVLIAEEGPFVRLKKKDCSVSNTFPLMWREGGIIPIWGNAKFVFAEGRCVGGSTMVNSGLIHRLPDEIISEWIKEFKIVGLEVKWIGRYHDEVEEALGVKILNNEKNEANLLFKKGARDCNFKGMDVPVAATFSNGNIKKNNMVETFLKKAFEGGAKIIPGCRVDKIIIKGRKAIEVYSTYTGIRGEKYRLRIKIDKLFICSGAIQTPLILRRSGIRNNIGNSIGFHPTLRIVADFGYSINAYSYEMPSYQIKEFSPDISMGASVSMYPFLATGLSFNWERNRGFLKDMKDMAIYYITIRSNSKGMVRNLPVGNSYMVRYPLNQKDLKNLSFGYSKLCQLLFAAGAKRLFPAIDGVPYITEKGEPEYYQTNYLDLKKINLMSIHAFGSCPMGEDKNLCAVDSFGKLHKFENIYINDASILPNSPGVNPQGPLMAIALRNLETNFG